LRLHVDPPLGGAPTEAAPDAEWKVFRVVVGGDLAAGGWCVELWHDGGGGEGEGRGEGREHGSEPGWQAARFEELSVDGVKTMVRSPL
jgi:hypothetical protein